MEVLSPQGAVIPDDLGGSFGNVLAGIDANADGFDDLAVGTGDSRAEYVFVYSGGPSGLAAGSELPLPVPPWKDSAFFGGALVNAGDTDGDGFPELLTADPAWGPQPSGWDDRHLGALFVYAGGPNGVDECPLILTVPPPKHDGSSGPGSSISGRGDLDGDGYSDFASSCQECSDDRSSPFVYWLGAADAPRGPYLGVGTGYRVDVVGDLDADGFDELAVSAEVSGTLVYYGSPSGPDTARPLVVSEAGGAVSAAGDLDLDGFDDVVLGTYWSQQVGVLFGDPARADNPLWLNLPAPSEPHYWGGGVFGVGDLDGDGRPDVVGSDMYSGDLSGMVRVFFPTCTWYEDGDGDGAGAAAAALSTCRDPGAGWAAHPDDCDDSDATSQGQPWFPDDDGDGFGVTSRAEMACSPPVGTADRAGDCDDHDGARHPGADDLNVDGTDQDCDGHDGPWPGDTGDCPDPTDTGAGDAADSGGAETGDGSGPGDSGSTSVTTPRDPACACGATGVRGSLLAAVAATAFSARRRRASPS